MGGYDDAQGGIHLVSWSSITQLTDGRGLGICSVSLFDDASLLAKLGWMFLSQLDTLWARLLRDKYPTLDADHYFLKMSPKQFVALEIDGKGLGRSCEWCCIQSWLFGPNSVLGGQNRSMVVANWSRWL